MKLFEILGKEETTGIIRGVLFGILFYLLGCFVSASFNLKDWDVVCRSMVGFFGAIAIIIGYISAKKNL